jgi:hypothetical protein
MPFVFMRREEGWVVKVILRVVLRFIHTQSKYKDQVEKRPK